MVMPPPGSPSCWVLTDGKPGMENQCLGLAEALNVPPVVKRIAPRPPWRWLPPRAWIRPLAAPGPGGDRLAPPWPELLIATGRQTAAIAAAIRRQARGRTFVVQIQNPRLDAERFDLVVVPAHDRLTGRNVITTRGALHRVTPGRLAEAAAHFAPTLAHLPRPRVAVLVGGSDRRGPLTPDAAAAIGARIAAMARREGAGLMVTPSRRTGAANLAALRAALAGVPSVIWDGVGENPYFGFLGLADAILVTEDSVSMVSEACATGKPVHIVPLGRRAAKLDRFHGALIAAGITRPFAGTLERWTYVPPDDTARVAAEVERRMRTGDRLRAGAPPPTTSVSGPEPPTNP